MKACIRFIWIGLVALMGAPGVPAAQESAGGNRPIQVDSYLEAVIPADLKSMLLREAWVKYLITVNAEGVLVDYMPVEATHYGLLERGEQCLRNARFSPALSNGKPVQSSMEVAVTFFDPEQRAFHSGLISTPYGSSSMDAAVRWMSEASMDTFRYRESTPSELDHPLELKSAKVLVLTDVNGRPAEGDCMVEFYIDADGNVRMPRIVSSDNELVSKSALMTIRESRFAPLTRKGKPTYVKVQQPIRFHPSSKKSASS